MANTFKLGDFILDATGHVQSGGSWKTDPDNRITVESGQGTARVFDVDWSFNSYNQLQLSAGGEILYNFNADRTIAPRFELRNAVLRVSPDTRDPFVFELRGEWDLTTAHDLKFTPAGGKESTISGFVNSPAGKFVYFFSDRKRPLLQHKLAFAGTWATSGTAEGQLLFHFRREDASEDTFELPGKVTINKSTNQLRYEYKKGGLQAIDFDGTLIVHDDFTLTYHLSRQLSAAGDVMVNETTLSFGAVFQKSTFTGDLELALTKPDGSVSATTLTIAGRFTGVLGKTCVTAGFTFDQLRDGQKVTTTFGFDGKIQSSAGTFVFAFNTPNGSAGTINLALNAEIRLNSRANADVRFNVDVGGGQLKGVAFLLGANF